MRSRGGYALCKSIERLILAKGTGEIKAALEGVSRHIVSGKISLWDIMRVTMGRIMMKDEKAQTLSEVLKDKFRMLPQNALEIHISILEIGQRVDSIIENGRSEMLAALRRAERSTDADAEELDNLIVGNCYNGYPMPTVPCNTCGAAVVQYYDWRYENIHRETSKACAEIVRRKRVLAEQQKELADCVRKQLMEQLFNYCKNSFGKPKKPVKMARK